MTKTRRIPRDRAFPAPGELEILQSLLDTHNVAKGYDEIGSPRLLASWLSRWRLMPATAELTEADVERVVHVRGGLRALLRTHTGAALDDAALDRLDEATVGARVEVRFDREGAARFEPASQSLADAVGVILAIVVLAQKESRWRRFKVCANPGCQRAFYDAAPSGTGKWCCLRCGDLIRARAYRQGERYQRKRG